MEHTLTKAEWESILTSLRSSKTYIESQVIGELETYPDYATKRASLDRIEALIEKVRIIKNATE